MTQTDEYIFKIYNCTRLVYSHGYICIQIWIFFYQEQTLFLQGNLLNFNYKFAALRPLFRFPAQLGSLPLRLAQFCFKMFCAFAKYCFVHLFLVIFWIFLVFVWQIWVSRGEFKIFQNIFGSAVPTEIRSINTYETTLFLFIYCSVSNI